MAATPTPRTTARLLVRTGRADPGLFAPLVLAQAAEIEALPLTEFLGNPTKLSKGLLALHRALGTDAVVTTPDRLVADAAGAEVDWSSYPPAVVSHPGRGSLPADLADRAAAHPLVAAAADATARLATTAPGDPIMVAAVTGPATLAAELGGEWFTGAAAESHPLAQDFVESLGHALLAVTSRLLEAGANLVVLVESKSPPESMCEAWRSTVTPIVNVSRFHQAAPVMVFEAPSPTGWAAAPPSVGMCVTHNATVPGPPKRLRGVALPSDPREWEAPAGQFSLLTTAGAVPDNCAFAETLSACNRIRPSRSEEKEPV